MTKMIKIIILSILICLLILCMFYFMNSDFKFSFEFKEKSKIVFDETYSINDINAIDISTKSSDVKIRASEDDKIYVKIYSRKDDEYKVENKNNILLINKEKQSNCIGFCYSKEEIQLSIPKEYIGTITSKSTSGDILSTINNNIDYKISTKSGDIKIHKARNISGKLTSGDLEVQNITSSIKYEATSGDIEIDNFTILKDSSIKVTSGDVEIDHVSDVYIDASVTSGNVKAKGSNRYADYELKVRATSGDININ